MRLKITSIILLFAYLALWLKPLYPFIEFELNKEYIIETLCVERNKEVNTCQGQCHLKEKVKKSSDQDENQKNTFPGPNSENKIFLITHSRINSHLPESPNTIHCLYINNYIFLLNNEHFHPPEIA